jgi:hypothetical protein
MNLGMNPSSDQMNFSSGDYDIKVEGQAVDK